MCSPTFSSECRSGNSYFHAVELWSPSKDTASAPNQWKAPLAVTCWVPQERCHRAWLDAEAFGWHYGGYISMKKLGRRDHSKCTENSPWNVLFPGTWHGAHFSDMQQPLPCRQPQAHAHLQWRPGGWSLSSQAQRLPLRGGCSMFELAQRLHLFFIFLPPLRLMLCIFLWLFIFKEVDNTNNRNRCIHL